MLLKKYQEMLEELKKQSRGKAIYSRMKETLDIMKGKLRECSKM